MLSDPVAVEITPLMQTYIFATDYSWYGLANLYNSMLLEQEFNAKDYSSYFEDTAK